MKQNTVVYYSTWSALFVYFKRTHFGGVFVIKLGNQQITALGKGQDYWASLVSETEDMLKPI